MTIAICIICLLVASNILWLFAAARILDKLNVAKRDNDLMGARIDRLTAELRTLRRPQRESRQAKRHRFVKWPQRVQ